MDILIQKAKKGDEEAFMNIIDEYMVQMYKVAKTRLKDEDLIGDAIQETILSAYKNIKKLKEVKYFNTWLIKILINKCNDINRKNNVEYIDDYNKINDENLLYTDNNEDKLDFESTLNILNSEHKTVIVMYYVNKFTVKEISEILNEKEGTIKSRLSRARERLRDYYEKRKSICGGEI